MEEKYEKPGFKKGNPLGDRKVGPLKRNTGGADQTPPHGCQRGCKLSLHSTGGRGGGKLAKLPLKPLKKKKGETIPDERILIGP